ncbi:hypothetical protein [Actinomadura formosensis]|uniref:hypothetical protein n=1 Tax=Actinomadura formosensis TaxID=60706 RepID=UPI003D8B3D49
MRTQDEIVARLTTLSVGEDVLGFRRGVLIAALNFEHARPFLKSDVTPEKWDEIRVRPDDIEDRARDYYAFALTKIEGHRGISASRSVDKLGEYAWLLGRDDVVDAMAAADFAQYGAPIVKAFADGFGETWPDEPWAVRMAKGLPCEPDCDMGCGQ